VDHLTGVDTDDQKAVGLTVLVATTLLTEAGSHWRDREVHGGLAEGVELRRVVTQTFHLPGGDSHHDHPTLGVSQRHQRSAQVLGLDLDRLAANAASTSLAVTASTLNSFK
jgi:hypothetical protein